MSRRYYALFLILFSTAPLKAAAQKTCNQNQRTWALTRVGELSEAFDQETLRLDDVENLTALAERCNLDLGISGDDLSRWRNMAVENEMTSLRERIVHYSHFRSVENEISTLRSFAELHEQEFSASELETFRRNGAQASQRERQSCQPTVDLRGPRLGPVRDQGEIGWCYAFATADLVTYHTGRRVSGLGIALSYYEPVSSNNKEKVTSQLETPLTALESGNVSRALDRAQNAGMCLESELRSEDNGSSHIVTHMRQIEDSLEQPENCEDAFQSVQALFPSVEFQDFVDVLQTATVRSILPDLAKRACTPQDLPKMKSTVVTADATIQSQHNLFRTVDERLNNNQPVAISYGAESLSDIYFERPTESPHVSTLVGRRFNEASGQCEYLLRNTWGRGCGGYHSSYTCEEGHIWIPKGSLARSVGSATYIE